jgi:hypothetical protein
MTIENYTIDEHVHRFACWTAARAASVGNFKNTEIESCFQKISLREKVQSLKEILSLTHDNYSV